MPVRLKCKECGRRYYTAKSTKQVKKTDRECQECGGELKICKTGFSAKEDSGGEKDIE